jgi:sugar phosphate isomerase/epimerase
MATPITFSTLACPEWPAERVIARAAEYGYAGLEWRGGGQGHVSPALSQAARADLRRQMAEAGLFALAVTAYSSFVSDNPADLESNLDELRRHVDLAADLGARYVRAFAGELRQGQDLASASGRVADCLRGAAEHAQSVGIAIALEPHDDFARAAVIAPILSRAAHPALGVIWDISATRTRPARTRRKGTRCCNRTWPMCK